MITINIIFFLLILVIFYTYIGYGIIIYSIVQINKRINKKQNISITNNIMPEATLLIAAYNEESVIEEKMRNCNELDYPKDKLNIIWVTDGSNDKTNELLKSYSNVTVLFQPERKGKTAAINRGMDYVSTPITIFTDANTLINPESIKEIAYCFIDKNIGCVAGEKRIARNTKGNNTANGEGMYWKYESAMKKWDFELNSAVGAAGELYAIRTELFDKLPEDTLLDDFMLSMHIILKGYKIAYCNKAYATEGGSANIKEEEKRKIRIAAGGLQSILRLKELLNIFKYGTISFQYMSHRVLRWSITPVAMFILFPLNIYLAIYNENIIYDMILIGQIIFYCCGIAGKLLIDANIRNKYLYIPYYFLFMNVNVIKGFIYLMKKNSNDGTWEKSKRA